LDEEKIYFKDKKLFRTFDQIPERLW